MFVDFSVSRHRRDSPYRTNEDLKIVGLVSQRTVQRIESSSCSIRRILLSPAMRSIVLKQTHRGAKMMLQLMVDGRVNRAISVVRSQIRTTIQNIYYCSLPLLRGNLDVSSSGTWYFANSEFPRFPTVNLSSATTFYHASLKPLAPGNRLRTITSDPYTTIRRFLFELVHHWTEIIDKQ